jgi:NAD(P)-dependent dehydrogenase (short-subunit alcohol dehydrogenase family)
MTNDVTKRERIALVTGANKGIGLEVVAQLAGLGMTVLLGARDRERREKAVAELAERGLTAHPLALDVTDAVSVAAAAAEVEERFGRLDVLVNNAGINCDRAAQRPGSADLAATRQVFEVNVFGAISVTEAMMPLLRRSPAGRIVNLSSSLGSIGLMTTPGTHQSAVPPSTAYRVSKTALNALTANYGKQLREEGILVNAADPGLCATDLAQGIDRPVSRTAAQGAAVAVRLATLGDDGPAGGFFSDDGPLPW